MKNIAQKEAIFLLLFLFSFSNCISLGQPNYLDTIVVNLIEDDISLAQGDSIILNVTVFDNSDPINASYFEIQDQSGNILIDIGESQVYTGGGNYQILLHENISINIVPGNYSAVLVAYFQSQLDTVPFSLAVTSLDVIAPVMTILKPLGNETIDEAVFQIVVEATDDIAWRDISINLGSIALYYLERTEEISTRPASLYNQTYLHIEYWLDVLSQSNVQSNQVTIIIRDMAFNEASSILTIEGDISGPQISWSSHENNERIYSTQVLLEWVITDESSIQSQLLQIDDKPFTPKDQAFQNTTRSLNFNLPINPDEPTFVKITLIAMDEFGNRAEQSIVLIYDTGGGNDDSNASFRDNAKLIYFLLGMVLVTLLGSLILILIADRKDETTPKLKQSDISKNFPKLEIAGAIQVIDEHVKLSITKLLNEFEVDLKSISVNQSGFEFVQKLRSDFVSDLIRLDAMDQQVILNVDSILQKWMGSI